MRIRRSIRRYGQPLSPGRFGAANCKAGGYLVLHAIVAAPDLFDAAIDLYGKTNMFTAQAHADRPYVYAVQG